MDGSGKNAVPGKSEKPRCFKNAGSLPSTCGQNNTAWITYVLSIEFLTCLGRRKAAEDWKILLYLDLPFTCMKHKIPC